MQPINQSLSLFAFLLITAQCIAAVPGPNVILIMADDLGYNDLSCYGSQTINTPILDNLAAEGVRLTSFYSGCTICTPSRMSLLTGMYPVRCGWQGGVVGYGVKPKNGLAPQVTTIAEVYKQAGYKTALIGKWHLGDTAEHSPTAQGFENTFYIDKSNNQTKKLWRGDKLVADPFDNRRLTEQFTAEAIKFIEANQKDRFFLYLPLSAPHFPAQAHPDWKGRSKLGAYGDVVEELDSRIGEILNTLNKHNLDDNTIVVFLSDNGVEPGQKQWARSTPYRGLKWSTMEGGNRVPCIIRWPGKIPVNQVRDELIAAIDLFPTLTDACQLQTQEQQLETPDLDGMSILSTLLNRTARTHPRSSLLYWHGWGTPQAIRVGEWKLYFDHLKELPESKTGPVLINLINDPGEETNLSKKHPKRVLDLMNEARRQLTGIQADTIPLGGPPNSDARIPAKPKWLK
tara:strand:+ start:40 stop:1410 length:1371 start_codon:yes stop_codon:yes gene_type:complete